MSSNGIKWLTRILNNEYLALFLRLLVGGILVFSSVTKLPLHSQFVTIVESYHLLPQPLAIAYALALPWVELLVGSYLILGIQIKPSAVGSLLLSISFLIANVKAIIQGETFCGSCFGEAVLLPVSLALILDVFIITAVLILIISGGGKQLLGFDSWFACRQQDKIANLNSTEVV
jgi:putative oxidoreductase